MTCRRYLSIILLTSMVLSAQRRLLPAQERAPGGAFKVQFGKSGITSLKRAGDRYDTEYIARNRELGHVSIRYQMGDNAWRPAEKTGEHE